MADQDTTTKVKSDENTDKGVETEQSADETKQEDNQNNEVDTGKEQSEEKSNDEKSEEKSEDGDKTEEETKAEFKKRFTQLKGETPEEYLKNLEDAYANSSTEGQRLSQRVLEAERKFDQVATLVANDPEFAEKITTATDEKAPAPIIDPAVQWARQEMEKEFQRDYNAFAELHPEIVSDTELYNSVVQELDVISAAHEARGAKLTMAEGLRKAWISLGYDEKDNKEEAVNKTKEEASATPTQSKSKVSDDKPQFTKGQLEAAEKMGLTKEQLAEYNK